MYRKQKRHCSMEITTGQTEIWAPPLTDSYKDIVAVRGIINESISRNAQTFPGIRKVNVIVYVLDKVSTWKTSYTFPDKELWLWLSSGPWTFKTLSLRSISKASLELVVLLLSVRSYNYTKVNHSLPYFYHFLSNCFGSLRTALILLCLCLLSVLHESFSITFPDLHTLEIRVLSLFLNLVHSMCTFRQINSMFYH